MCFLSTAPSTLTPAPKLSSLRFQMSPRLFNYSTVEWLPDNMVSQPNFLLPPFLTSTSFPFLSFPSFASLFFFPPFNNSRCPALAPNVRSVIAVRPAECFYFSLAHCPLLPVPKKNVNTFVIPLLRTKTCFRGAMLLAPFFGPKTFGLLIEDLAVAVVSFLDLIVPCAIFICHSLIE